ncbi:MAG TPA: rhomboid family intramembrane serine protease [Nitrospirae bacterium]|nr:rhomboid family protein [bacterium BMS3Abin10]GBE38639.1 rhomboid family protein [bacterium BMS3Bbin08]HDH51743.1 rhomboid family intramembrane serine protease [Nitrospirota bacterium]HDK16333.1 rhomboid family intramembrane serine protease [Nitrospirota bacterium]HDK81139.1 rhomboid family intramembrane serine protease [Nitrospirota bacterium]
MIPYKDDNPTRTFPYVTIGLIAVNTMVFIWQVSIPSDPERIAFAYGAVPHFMLTFSTVQPIHPFLSVFTSMFIHGSFLHLFANMLYLWIFGDNIEDRLGKVRFILFYLTCGLLAAYAHALTESHSMVPMIGASGAVSGILGAYLLLFPHAKVRTIVILVFFIQVVRLPALFVIGLWIAIQFINGLLSAGAAPGGGGVAWFAHIGGFISGVLLIKVFLGSRKYSLKALIFRN